eukprot:9222785-Ditylum_brightwellii.AAC.1
MGVIDIDNEVKRLGTCDVTKEGSADGISDGVLLSDKDSTELGTTDDIILGSGLGFEEGRDKGIKLDCSDGIELGSSEGVVNGTKLGFMLGTNKGGRDCIALSSLGLALGYSRRLQIRLSGWMYTWLAAGIQRKCFKWHCTWFITGFKKGLPPDIILVITFGLELGFEEGIVDGTKVKPVSHSRNNDGAPHSSACKRAALVALQHMRCIEMRHSLSRQEI